MNRKILLLAGALAAHIFVANASLSPHHKPGPEPTVIQGPVTLSDGVLQLLAHLSPFGSLGGIDSLEDDDKTRLSRADVFEKDDYFLSMFSIYSLVLKYHHFFPHPSQALRNFPWHHNRGEALSKIFLRAVQHYLEEYVDENYEGHKELLIFLKHLHWANEIAFISLFRSDIVVASRGKDLARTLEATVFTIPAHVLIKEFTRAFMIVPGYEALMLTDGKDALYALQTGSIKATLSFLLKAATVDSPKRRSTSLITPLKDAITYRAPIYDYGEVLGAQETSEYNGAELRLIILHFHQPHLKSLLVMGRALFDVTLLIGTDITVKIILTRLLEQLQCGGLEEEFPRLSAFFKASKEGEDLLNVLDRTFLEFARRHKLAARDSRTWQALQCELAHSGAIEGNVSEHLSVILPKLGHLKIRPQLVEAHEQNLRQLSRPCTPLSLFAPWRDLMGHSMGSIYVQPSVLPAISIVETYREEGPAAAAALFCNAFLETMRIFPLSLTFQYVLQAYARDARSLDALLMMLYVKMKRPISLASNDPLGEIQKIERVMVQSGLGTDFVIDLLPPVKSSHLSSKRRRELKTFEEFKAIILERLHEQGQQPNNSQV